MVSLVSPAGSMLPPAIPPSKRPTFSLKRDSSYLDEDSDTSVSTSLKKLKVAFSPNIDIRIMDDWTEKSFDLVKQEIHVAITKHLAPPEHRDEAPYASLLGLLGQQTRSQDAPTEKLLKKYILGIQARLADLGECGQLVMTLLNLSWIGRDEIFVAMYVKFLCSLAMAHAKFIPSIMDKLVAFFVKLPASAGRLSGEVPVVRSAMFTRVHLTIKTLLRHLPSATSALLRAIKFEFPTDLATTRSYLQYQDHLIRLAQHIPELKAEILALLIQRLVNIDVEIQQDLEDFEDEEEEELLQGPDRRRLVQRGDDDDESDSDSYSESEETVTEDEQRLRDIRLKLAKMDGTLDLLFEYYTPLINATLDSDVNESYQQLLTHFQTFILPSRTRHAQFLLFHFAQITPRHTAAFADHCLEIATHAGSVTQRLSACAYMSSFVARGARVSSKSVREDFDMLCALLDQTRQRYEPNCRGPDRRSYSLYYALAQAILYIFCFRWRDLVVGAADPQMGDHELSEDDILAEGRDLVWFKNTKDILQKNIYSILNPLKVCSPGIVAEFAKIAHHVKFMYVFSKLATNKRVRLGNMAAIYSSSSIADIYRRETAVDRKTGEGHLQLEAYFPFDPYHLPKSKKWIEGDYNEWKLPIGMKTDDDDGDSDEDDSEDEEGDEEMAETGVDNEFDDYDDDGSNDSDDGMDERLLGKEGGGN